MSAPTVSQSVTAVDGLTSAAGDQPSDAARAQQPPGVPPEQLVCGNGEWMRLRFSQLILQGTDSLELSVRQAAIWSFVATTGRTARSSRARSTDHV